MNPKTCNTICIVLAILIVGLIGYAAMNGGKLWGKENYRYIDCGTKPCTKRHEKNGSCIQCGACPPTVPCQGGNSKCASFCDGNCIKCY